jgi:hypothetical protein
MIRLILILILGLAGTGAGVLRADEAFFTEKVLPILAQRCFECHAHEKKIKGGLVLDSRAGWETGGDSGPAVLPGNVAESLLIQAVTHTKADYEMPPQGKLPEEEIAVLKQWVALGAPDPRSGGGGVAKAGIDIEAGRRHWSFRPLQKPSVPAVKNESWPRNDIDRFILAKLEAAGLQPAPENDEARFLRRLSYDLTGLPLRPDRVGSQETPDELLDSRYFAEKWARHWLDLARYADSNGSSFNPPFPMAWRYRNWVIDALHHDMPYDDFVRKQIAGDLLSAKSQEERDANLIATGYLMLGSKVLGEFDKEQLILDVVDEQVDTLGQSLLGLTLGCARCHDHKFDPLPQRDYYALAGLFTSTVTLQDRFGGPKEDESDWSRRGLGEGGDEKLRAFLRENRYAWVKATVKAYEKQHGTFKARPGEADPVETLAALEAAMPPYAEAVQESPHPADTQLRIRGVPSSKGETIPRGFLQVASYAGEPKVNPAQSGRLELAEWLSSPRNPLTARVIVNRVWQHLFGEGLVRTPDNFGTRGDPPTHPELLDFLAIKFIEGGWKLKPLIAEIVDSRAYRMSTRHSTLGSSLDPENTLLWRQNRRRLEPEEIRDTLLHLGGGLEPSPVETLLPGLPLKDLQGGDARQLHVQSRHRTLYQPIIRTMEREEFQIFDFAPTAMTTGQRAKTTVAPQALYFLNSSIVQEESQRFAERIAGQRDGVNVEPVILSAFREAIGRDPSADEFRLLSAYLETQFEGAPGPTSHDLAKLCQALLGSTAFQFLD